MDDLTHSLRSMLRLNCCVITSQPGQGYQILPVGFVLELGLLLVLAVIIPQAVPRLMGWIWPATRND